MKARNKQLIVVMCVRLTLEGLDNRMCSDGLQREMEWWQPRGVQSICNDPKEQA